MFICLYAYMLICLHAYMLICLYAYMLICLYAYMLIYFICLYAYILTCFLDVFPRFSELSFLFLPVSVFFSNSVRITFN